MDVSRRGFLKLFGIGAGAAAGGLILPGPVSASLFGVGDRDASGPLLGWHTVVTRNRVPKVSLGHSGIEKRAYNLQAFPGDGPGAHSSARIGEDGVGLEYEESSEIIVPIPSTDNPHIGYYVAAEEARRLFANRASSMLKRVPPVYRSKTKLVTVVHQPIYARPGGMWSGRDFDGSDSLEVVCDATTRVLWDDTTFEAWDVQSHYGEVPVETPSEISLRVLLDVDQKIVAQMGKEWAEYAALRSRRGFLSSLTGRGP